MSTRKKLKHSEIKKARDILVKRQKVCPLCTEKFSKSKTPVLDHDHKTGYLRDVLCRNCNGIEGKVYNLSNRAKAGLSPKDWLRNLIKYYERHEVSQHKGLIHPTHKTEAEKRLAKNKKARLKRAKAKKG